MPTSAVNSPSLAHICGDVAASYLDGFAQRMLLSKKDHQERVTHEGLCNMCYDPVLGHNGRVCSDFGCSLVRSGSFTFLFKTQCQSGLFCVYKKNLSLRLILDTRRSNQRFRVPLQFSIATVDSFSRVELLNGTLDGGGAPALHIATGGVQNAFHHIPDWL